MDWFEKLPVNCPSAKAVSRESFYFRLGSIPPDESDFWSHRKRFPYKEFKVDECIAFSLSLFDSLEAVERLKRAIPALRKKTIVKLDLRPADGLIQQTGNDSHHFSWWRSKEFNTEKIKIIKS
jgi:hypothetical protein